MILKILSSLDICWHRVVLTVIAVNEYPFLSAYFDNKKLTVVSESIIIIWLLVNSQ